MQVETAEPPTAAELELEASLNQLGDAIARVPEAERKPLSTLLASLHTLDEAMAAEDPRRFVQSLVDLARAVIEVRKTAQFTALPVPPYDLWLPFKARSLRSSDQPSNRYTTAVPVINKKIAGKASALLDLLKQLECEEAPLQQVTGERGDSEESQVLR